MLVVAEPTLRVDHEGRSVLHVTGTVEVAGRVGGPVPAVRDGRLAAAGVALVAGQPCVEEVRGGAGRGVQATELELVDVRRGGIQQHTADHRLDDHGRPCVVDGSPVVCAQRRTNSNNATAGLDVDGGKEQRLHLAVGESETAANMEGSVDVDRLEGQVCSVVDDHGVDVDSRVPEFATVVIDRSDGDLPGDF